MSGQSIQGRIFRNLKFNTKKFLLKALLLCSDLINYVFFYRGSDKIILSA